MKAGRQAEAGRQALATAAGTLLSDLRACFVNSSNNSSRSLFLGMLPTKRRWLFNDGRIAMLLPFRTSKPFSWKSS